LFPYCAVLKAFRPWAWAIGTPLATKVAMIAMIPMFGAIGYSLIYLLLGGGFGGAVLIFIIAKMLGK
jgi:hypothetical protein